MKKLRGTDPRLVLQALELSDRIGIRPAGRELGVDYRTVWRWRCTRAAEEAPWPTQEMVDDYLAGLGFRRHRAELMAQYRKTIILGRHRPAWVDSTGTVRRIRALQRLGWSGELIALHGPWETANGVIDIAARARVTRTNAEIVAEIYDLLSMTIGPSDATRQWAEAQKWPPPLGWNDESIDDPSALPHGVGLVRRNQSGELDLQAVDRILGGDWKTPANKATRVEVVRRWDDAGGVRNELARLTGWKIERYSRPIRESVAS